MIKFPYGLCDFNDIIMENYYYADRTDRIPMIEDAGKHLLFLRPRRFGKSLLLSTLENYYDVAKADQFDKLFGHLAIGKTPTPLHNRYFVMNWDFSAVSAQGNISEIRRSLHDHVNGSIEIFKAQYSDILDYDINIDPNNALRSFQSVLAAIRKMPYKLYLLIDEYDNFANEVMTSNQGYETATGQERYENLLYGDGELKTIFKAVKSATRGQGLDRTFMTGVSPVVLSDVTSGHNIAENIYLKPWLDNLCGFMEAEIETVLKQVIEECNLPEEMMEEALDMMQTYYNGYRFSYDSKKMIHNPTLVLYFMKHFQETCAYPQKMLDSNLAPDRGKITYIANLPDGEQVIAKTISGEEPLTVSELSDRFGIKDILYAPKDDLFMVSLLYYFGVLTLTGKRTGMGKVILKIPNLVIQKLYVEQIREMLIPDFNSAHASQVTETFCQTGDIKQLCEFIETKLLTVFDNRDYLHANELTIKTAFLTLLYNDTFYIMDSETALERSYADLTMIVRPDMRQYELLDMLIEFKYISLKETGLSGEKIKQMSREELKKIPLVKKRLKEAGVQVKKYRKKLSQIYGSTLDLRAYSVVSVGFERLVWAAEKLSH